MAAAVRTLADFVAACDDFDEVQELLDLSAGEMQAVLEEYPALLKDAAKTAGRKQREKLMSEHKGMQGGAQEAQPEANGAQEAQLEVTCPVLRSSVCYLYEAPFSLCARVCMSTCTCLHVRFPPQPDAWPRLRTPAPPLTFACCRLPGPSLSPSPWSQPPRPKRSRLVCRLVWAQS